MEKLLFEDSSVNVFYDSQYKLAKVIWLGTPKEDNYKKPFELLLKYGQNNLIEYFLSDTSKQGDISVQNRKWFEQEMIYSAKRIGLKRGAVVIEENSFKQYYMNMIMLKTKRVGILTRVFTDYNEALNWLLIHHYNLTV